MDIEEQIEILTAYSDGKPLQCRGTEAFWRDHSGGIPYVQGNQLQWRIKPEESKPKIAEGHNPDKLTEEQVGVKDGWRLLSRNEVDYFISICNYKQVPGLESWGYPNSGWNHGAGGTDANWTYRTKKPIGCYDNGVPMKRVALTHDDFPLGCQVRTGYADGIVVRRTPGAISVMCGEYYMSSLVDPEYQDWQRSLDGGKTWLPCYKEVPETE